MRTPTKEERMILREEGNNINSINFRFEIRVVGCCKEEKNQMLHRLHVLGMNDDMWVVKFGKGMN